MAHAGDRLPAATPVDHPPAPYVRARLRGVRRAAARGVLVATCLASALSGVVLTATPAGAENPPTPGNVVGLGFDQCLAPTASAMKAWWTYSPYIAVGIYISGDSRGCRSQPNLSASWVAQQQALGWKLLPITLGPQAACTTRDKYRKQVRINASSSGDYSAARRQGTAEAAKAVAAARQLGIAAGSTLWYDLEAFPTSSTSCKDSAMAFLSGWTNQLHTQKYVSGAYSSAASGIKVMAAALKSSRFTMPDRVWIADWNGKADTKSSYISSSYWAKHQRVHQYRGGHDEKYGSVTINIDNNYLDLGQGNVAPAKVSSCDGTHIDWFTYRTVKPGSTDTSMVKTLQCLLSQRGDYQGDITGSYDSATMAAAKAFQTRLKLPVSTTWSARHWTALTAAGSAPSIKLGSSSNDVRRLQRALNATGRYEVPVTGIGDTKTLQAVRSYQRSTGLSLVTLAGPSVWASLQKGVTG